jgi:carbonic anhydrase/acetyltransferase-like protein (isoleucine patch superfamily)
VAAGALVPERMVVPARSLVVGVPGKVKRALTEVDVEGNRMYAARYVEYAREYMEEGN